MPIYTRFPSPKDIFLFLLIPKNKLLMRAKAPVWTGMNVTEKQLYPLIPHMCALHHQKHLSDT